MIMSRQTISQKMIITTFFVSGISLETCNASTDLILTILDCTILTYITEIDLSNNNYIFARPENIFAKKITKLMF